MKNKCLMSVLGAVVLGVGTTAQAIPAINGSISFGGATTLNTTSLSTATAFTGYSSLSVLAGLETLAYAPLNGGGNFGGTLSFGTFSFGGNTLSPNPVNLWTVTSGGVTYSFKATSVHIDTQTSTHLDLSGTGVAHIDGFQDTFGTWTIDDTVAGSGSGVSFQFGAASTAVPDGGMTAGLLGASLLGLAAIRKLKTKGSAV